MKIIPILSVVLLSACGGEEVSFATLEMQRAVANDNSKFNAQRWRGENGYANYTIYPRGDSTQQVKCPQGDGWASIDLLNPDSKTVQISLKCSTISGNLGCMTADDFKSKPVFASQENKCNDEIPSVMTKIEQ